MSEKDVRPGLLLWTIQRYWKQRPPFVRIIRFAKCSDAQFGSQHDSSGHLMNTVLKLLYTVWRKKTNKYSRSHSSVKAPSLERDCSHVSSVLQAPMWPLCMHSYLIWINHCMRQPLHFNSSIFIVSLPLAGTHNTRLPLHTLQYASVQTVGPLESIINIWGGMSSYWIWYGQRH